MSFSGGGNPGVKEGQGGPSVGDSLMSYINQRFPIAGSLAGAVMPHDNPQPSMQMKENPVPQVGGDFIQANAMPKQGGEGLSMLMKLFGG